MVENADSRGVVEEGCGVEWLLKVVVMKYNDGRNGITCGWSGCGNWLQ